MRTNRADFHRLMKANVAYSYSDLAVLDAYCDLYEQHGNDPALLSRIASRVAGDGILNMHPAYLDVDDLLFTLTKPLKVKYIRPMYAAPVRGVPRKAEAAWHRNATRTQLWFNMIWAIWMQGKKDTSHHPSMSLDSLDSMRNFNRMRLDQALWMLDLIYEGAAGLDRVLSIVVREEKIDLKPVLNISFYRLNALRKKKGLSTQLEKEAHSLFGGQYHSPLLIWAAATEFTTFGVWGEPIASKEFTPIQAAMWANAQANVEEARECIKLGVIQDEFSTWYQRGIKSPADIAAAKEVTPQGWSAAWEA